MAQSSRAAAIIVSAAMFWLRSTRVILAIDSRPLGVESLDLIPKSALAGSVDAQLELGRPLDGDAITRLPHFGSACEAAGKDSSIEDMKKFSAAAELNPLVCRS